MKKINPYSILGVISLVVIFLYELGWSSLYPKLTVSVIVFILLLIVLCFIFSFCFQRNFIIGNFTNQDLFSFKKVYIILTILVLFGVLCDGIYSGGFPLFGSIKYGDDYGIPTIHVIITIFNSYLTYVLALMITFDKSIRKKASIWLIINIICLLLPLSRMIIILTFSNYLWSYLYLTIGRKRRIAFFRKLIIVVCVLLGMYVFGVLGNYRTNIQVANNRSFTDSSLIFQIGMPSSRFLNLKLPSPFFWDYIYGTSPLANFQNITLFANNSNEGSGGTFIITQLLPDVIGKHTIPNEYTLIKTLSHQFQVTPILNVSTVFFQPYFLCGWFGVYVMLIFILLFPFIYLILLNEFDQKYFIEGLSILNTMYLFLFFDNMFARSVLSLQLIIPFILGVIRKYKK